MKNRKSIAGRGIAPSPRFPGSRKRNPAVRLRVLCTGAPRLSSVDLVRKLERRFPSWDIDFCRGKSTYTHVLMSIALSEARDSKCDFFIMMADDLGLEDASLLGRLPQHHVPVVDCLVPNWQLGDFYWNCYQLTKNWILYSENPYNKSGLMQIYASALACCCYRRDVLDLYGDKLKMSFDASADGNVKFMGGNDSYFCRQLHEQNIPLYMDMDIRLEHLAQVKLKQTMDRIRQWGEMCLGDTFRNGVAQYGYFLPARICVDTKALGERLPVCASYQQTEAWDGKDEGISVPFAGVDGKKTSGIPQNGG